MSENDQVGILTTLRIDTLLTETDVPDVKETPIVDP